MLPARCPWARTVPGFYQTYHDEEWGRVIPATVADRSAKGTRARGDLKKAIQAGGTPTSALAAATDDAALGRRRDGHYLFELLCLEGQQCGLSWVTVLRKRDAYRSAFLDFHPERIASRSAESWGKDVDRLLERKPANASRRQPEAKSSKKEVGEGSPEDTVIRHRGKLEAIVQNARAYKHLTNALAARLLAQTAVGDDRRSGRMSAAADAADAEDAEDSATTTSGGKKAKKEKGTSVGVPPSILRYYPGLTYPPSPTAASLLFADYLWDFSYRPMAGKEEASADNCTAKKRGRKAAVSAPDGEICVRRVLHPAFALTQQAQANMPKQLREGEEGKRTNKEATPAALPFPTTNPNAEALSRVLKRCGFRYTGPTTLYAMFQAAGMVNDHTQDCWRFRPDEDARAAVFNTFDRSFGEAASKDSDAGGNPILNVFRDTTKLIAAVEAEAKKPSKDAGTSKPKRSSPPRTATTATGRKRSASTRSL